MNRTETAIKMTDRPIIEAREMTWQERQDFSDSMENIICNLLLCQHSITEGEFRQDIVFSGLELVINNMTELKNFFDSVSFNKYAH